MDANIQKLQEIFNEVFDNCPQINADTLKSDIGSWDSMSFLNLIVELESAYDREFTVEEMEKIDSVASILKLIE